MNRAIRITVSRDRSTRDSVGYMSLVLFAVRYLALFMGVSTLMLVPIEVLGGGQTMTMGTMVKVAIVSVPTVGLGLFTGKKERRLRRELERKKREVEQRVREISGLNRLLQAHLHEKVDGGSENAD